MVSAVLKWIFGNLTLNQLKSQHMLVQWVLITNVKELNVEITIKTKDIKAFVTKMVVISTLIDTKKTLGKVLKLSLEKVVNSQ